MEKHTFTIDKGKAGQRLDRYLGSCFSNTVSRTYLQRLIGQGKILVNGVPRKSRYNVKKGDFIEVEISEPKKPDVKAENIPLNIIYEDDRLVVVDKPAGMVVHPAPGNYSGTLVNALLYHINSLSSSESRPGIVHRLDKDTSGLLIVAKDDAAHSFLTRQFGKRTADKRYLAIVEGVVQLDNGVISYPIGRHVRDRKRMSVKFSEAKCAITNYRVLERFKDKTFLEIKPETGRTHQIRVHMAYIGYPVAGDTTYGRKKRDSLIKRQMLHASRISFFHPTTKEQKTFESALPEDMKTMIEKLKAN